MAGCKKMRKNQKQKAIKVSREILKYLFLTGAIFIAASSPYFVAAFIKNIERSKQFRGKKFQKKKLESTFQYLRRRGLLEIKKKNYDIIISLTKKGKERAKKYQIDDLKVRIPRKWDRKWRLVIFDIPHFQTTERNAFRRKLKELGFYPLQKSVWLYPFDCKKEIEFLRNFFGIEKDQIQVLLVEKIEDDKKIKKFFNLK